jgi:hypothetical protein
VDYTHRCTNAQEWVNTQTSAYHTQINRLSAAFDRKNLLYCELMKTEIYCKIAYPELLGLADAAVRVDVCYVDGGVPLVASDPAANAHAQ